VSLDPGKLYYALNKAGGVVTTSKDPEGRTTVLDLLGFAERVLPVGRLGRPYRASVVDQYGELSHRLAHPRTRCPGPTSESEGGARRVALRRLPRRVSRSPKAAPPGPTA